MATGRAVVAEVAAGRRGHRLGGSKVRIARCKVESPMRLGRHRWKAERSIAWLAGCRRLRICYDRSSERFFAFAMLACDRLCYNRLPCAAKAHARSP